MEKTLSYINKIQKLSKKNIFSIGCGSGYLEHYLKDNNIISNIYCINKPGPTNFPFDKKLSKINGFQYEEHNFITHNFKKKYDLLLFINSLQFILGENLNTIDKNYFEFIKQKLNNLLKKNGYIYIEITDKKWFIQNKQSNEYFLESLDNCINNILKMEFMLILNVKDNQRHYLILQKNDKS